MTSTSWHCFRNWQQDGNAIDCLSVHCNLFRFVKNNNRVKLSKETCKSEETWYCMKTVWDESLALFELNVRASIEFWYIISYPKFVNTVNSYTFSWYFNNDYSTVWWSEMRHKCVFCKIEEKKNPRLFNEIVAHGLDPDQN